MKKFYLLVVLVLLMGTSLHAKQIDVNEAKEIAAQYLQQKSVTRAAGGDLRLAYTATSNGGTTRASADANLLYVFDRGDANGFVVIAGDDRMRPVLGYTSTGSFDLNTPNEGFQWWLKAITATAKAVANGSDSGTATSTRATENTSVEPLIQTQWNQQAPYYNLCPYDDNCNGQSVTGCAATALAQVLYYWYHDTTQTLSGTGHLISAHNTSEVKDVELSQFTIDYTKMALTYDGSESDESKETVATLMYACGLTLNMQYCTEGSNTNISSYPLIKFFGIDSGCKTAYRSQYTSDGWDELVRGELDNGRPLLYGGQSANGGHEFICDGYDSDGLYHINWGWGGRNDGYFDFYSIDFQYVDMQDVVCGIKPGKGVANYSDLLSYCTLTADGSLPLNNVTTLTCYISKLCCGGGDFEGGIGLALCKDDGTIVLTSDLYGLELGNGHGISSDLPITFPNNIANGTYYLRVIAGESPEDMHIIKADGVFGYLTVTVKDGKITVSGYQPETATLSLEDFAIEDGLGYANATSTITLKVKNTGKDEFYGYIYGDKASTVKAAIKPGESTTVNTNITPDAIGENKKFHFWAVDEYGGDSISIGDVVFDVVETAKSEPKLVADSVYFEKTDVAYGDSMIVAVRVHNEGGKFDGGLFTTFKVDGNIKSDDTNYDFNLSGNSDGVALTLAREDSATVYIPIDYSGIEEYYNGTINYCTITINEIVQYVLKNQIIESTIASFDGDKAPTANIKREQTGIDGVTASDGLAVSASGNTIVVSGTDGTEIIRVYTVGGSLVKEVKAGSGSTSIYGLQSGQSYIVNVKGQSVKVAL